MDVDGSPGRETESGLMVVFLVLGERAFFAFLMTDFARDVFL